MRRVPIGQLLVQGGTIDSRQLRAGLEWQRRWGGRLGAALVHLGFAKESDVTGALGAQFHIEVVDLSTREVSALVLALVPRRVVEQRRVLPVDLLSETRRGPLLVATADPLDVVALDDVAFASGKQVRPLLASRSQLDVAIARHLRGDRHVALDLPPEPLEEMELVQQPRQSRFWN